MWPDVVFSAVSHHSHSRRTEKMVASVNEVSLEADPTVAEALSKIPSLARHLPSILLPLSGMIERYTANLDAARSRQLLEFFEFVRSTFSDDDYAAVQRSHLMAENVDFIRASNFLSSELKYLDFPFWAQSKFAVGRRLKLDQHAGEAILDIGSGPGHFGVVARFFGCDYEGLDIAHPPWTPFTKRHLYDDLCEFFQIRRRMNPVRPFEHLVLQRRYGLVTCLMGNFCSYDIGGSRRAPWSWREWAFLLEDLVAGVLTPAYNMYFHVSRDYLPPDVVENVRRFAKTFDEERSVFTFDETLDLDELRRSVPKGP